MAQFSWPFEDIDTTETQYSLLFKRFQDNGVVGDPSAAQAVQVATSSGMGITVAAGFALVRGFAYQNTSSEALTLDASDSDPRIDTVILTLDPVANSITVGVKKGTPGATPSAPALTQTEAAVYEMPLADILVPALAAALVPGNITDRRQFLGGQVGVWFTNSRPADAYKGRLGYNLTDNRFEWFDGSAWTHLIPISVNIPDGSITDAKLAIPPRRYLTIDNNTGTSLTLTSSLAGGFVRSRNIAGLTVNITTTSLTEGDRVDFVQSNVGPIEFVPGSGVVLLSKDAKRKTNGVYAAATLVRMNNGDYLIVGDLAA